jgi:hypothetical protein
MGIATGFTADHMDAIQAANVVSASIDANGELFLTRFDGSIVDAGNVKGLQGLKGPLGNTGAVGAGSSTDAQVAALINTANSATQAALYGRKVRINNTNWDNERAPGFIYGSNLAGSTPNPGFGPWICRVLAQPGLNLVVQIASRLEQTATKPQTYFRQYTSTGGGWSRWTRVFYDSGWINCPLADPGTTPGIGGLVQYRVMDSEFFIRSPGGVTFNSLAVGSNVVVCPPGAIIATYWPTIVTYGMAYYNNAVGYLRIGTDGSLQVHASTAPMSGANFNHQVPYEKLYS